ARGLQTASASAVQAPLSAPVSMTPGLAQQQQQASMLGANAMGPMPQNMQLQQKSVPLSSRLPPPLVPSRVNKPLTPQSNQVNFSHQQQQQQGQQHPSFAQRQQQQFSTSSALSPVGMFSASHGITNLPAASSSTTGLVPAGMSGGVFSNHAVTGSTPNLGSFTSSKSAMANVGNIGGGFGASSMAPSGFNNGGAATHSVTNFSSYSSGQINQPASQFMPQQQRLLQPSAAMAIGGINASQMSANQAGNKYDLFKSVNPHAPSIFGGNIQQQQQPLQSQMPTPGAHYSSSSTVSAMGFNPNNNQMQQQQQQQMGAGGIGLRQTGPTGFFAMANPTLASQPHQQYPSQQPPQQQPQQQQQQMFGANQAAGFGSQMQWH
ncbi:hypothetical protein EV174_005149, partial [Coemansia sp. RSA 2320]